MYPTPVRTWLAEEGYDPDGRAAHRVIQEQLKRPLAEELLFGVCGGGSVHVDRDEKAD